MEHEQQCDVAIFRVWPQEHSHLPCERGLNFGLEEKSAWGTAGSRLDDEALRRDGVIALLNEMTIELKAHFQFFKLLRVKAGEGELEGEEPDGKQLRADMKAASDALSLIVRTLEKIDELQRQLVKERDLALEDEAESQDYDSAVKFFLERIEALAQEKFQERLKALEGGLDV